MKVMPGTHLGDNLAHEDTYDENNMLTRGQSIRGLDESRAAFMPLGAGEMSLHNYCAAHGSGPNLSRDRRIGVSMHFMPPQTKQVVGNWDCAALVRGEDRYGNFERTPVPARDFDPEAVAFHARASKAIKEHRGIRSPVARRITASLLLTVGAGCAAFPDTETTMRGMYNVASSGTSKFDGTKHIRVSNMNCTGTIMFALYQDTAKSKAGVVLLMAGTKSIDNIGSGESLSVKVDGKAYSFTSSDAVTEHESIHVGHGVTMPFSHKTYVVPEALVREVAASQVFLARVRLLNNSYVEAKCSSLTLAEAKEENKLLVLKLTQEQLDVGNKFAAVNGFREFVRMLDTTAW